MRIIIVRSMLVMMLVLFIAACGDDNQQGFVNTGPATCTENGSLQFFVGINCFPHIGFAKAENGFDPDPQSFGVPANLLVMDSNCKRLEGEDVHLTFGEGVSDASDGSLMPLDLGGDTLPSGIQGPNVIFHCDDLSNNRCFVAVSTTQNGNTTTCTVGYIE